MEQLKEWISKHKALAAGGGLALAVLFFLWLRSGSSAPAQGQGDGGLNAYYAAQAASTADAAAVANSTNALAASTNQVNAAKDVALAQVAAAQGNTTAQIQAHTDELNLVAYQDYLAESSGAGGLSGAGPTELAAINYLGSGSYLIGAPGQTGTLIDIPGNVPESAVLSAFKSGQDVIKTFGASVLGTSGPVVPVNEQLFNYGGPGVANLSPSTPPLTFAQYTGQTIH